MTVDLRPSTVEACRDRDGAAAEDRPEGINEALNAEELGYGEGEPLVGESYSEYPSRTELSTPDSGDFLCSLLQHNKVGSITDAVEELTGVNDRGALSDWVSTVRTATEIHGFEVDALLDEGDQGGGEADTTVAAVLGYEPQGGVVSADNPLLVSELYCEGLSVVEIADTLDGQDDGVRDTLKDVGLLEGSTRAEQQSAFEENDGRLGGTTTSLKETGGQSRGLTVNVNDYA